MITLLLILCLFCSTLSAGTIDPGVSDSKYIDYAKTMPSVIRIMAIKKGVPHMGSAVVIKPNWVLTSAHIVEGDDPDVFLIKDKKAQIADKIIIHKNFARPQTRADIALVHIEQKIELENYPELYVDNDEVGKVCSISGYGITGNFDTGANTDDGLKRGGKNKISDAYNDDMLICTVKQRKRSTNMDFLIAGGDSGGGMFIDSKLAGINCCILSSDGSANADYDDDSGFMRISYYREWIQENTE